MLVECNVFFSLNHLASRLALQAVLGLLIGQSVGVALAFCRRWWVAVSTAMLICAVQVELFEAYTTGAYIDWPGFPGYG